MAKLVSNIGFQEAISAIPQELNLNFQVLRAFEGPQLLITWNSPTHTNYDGIKIVRKKGSYPLSIQDGLLVYSDDVNDKNYYNDQEVESLEIYYYTLFLHDPITDRWLFSTDTIGKNIAIETGYWERKLWQLLSPNWRTADRQ